MSNLTWLVVLIPVLAIVAMSSLTLIGQKRTRRQECVQAKLLLQAIQAERI
jgi:hypothetical protein